MDSVRNEEVRTRAGTDGEAGVQNRTPNKTKTFPLNKFHTEYVLRADKTTINSSDNE